MYLPFANRSFTQPFFMKKAIVFALFSFFILSCSKTFAQIFISFDGVKGESNFKAFASSTEISNLAWGVKNNSTIGGGGGASVGKAQVGELVITKYRGSSSPALQMCVFHGRPIPKAEIRFYKMGVPNPTSYLTITLENVLITNWSISADGRDGPKESFSLIFTKFKTQDAIQKADGTTEKIPSVGWDIQRNAAY